MDSKTRRPDPVLLALAGITIALVVIALIAVFTRGDRAELDPDTPEGVVQQLTSAMIAADRERARNLVDDAALENCDWHGGYTPERDTRVTLRGVGTSGSTATVRVGITSGYDGDVFSGTYEETGEFTLRRTGDEWLVTSAPWRFDLCTLGDVR